MRASRAVVIACMVGVGFVALATVGVGPVVDLFDDAEPYELSEPGTSTEYSHTTELSQPMVGQSEAIAPIAIPIAAAGGVAIGSYAIGKFTDDSDLQQIQKEDKQTTYFSFQNVKAQVNTTLTSFNASDSAVEVEAYSRAETAFARSAAQNNSLAEAQADAVDEVDEYIANVQRNEYVARNNHLVEQVKILSEDENAYNWLNERTKASGTINAVDEGSKVSVQSSDISLVNGDTAQVTNLKFDGGGRINLIGPNYEKGISGGFGDIDSDGSDEEAEAWSANQSSTFQAEFQETKDLHTAVINEIDNFSSAVSEDQFDDLDPADIPSPGTLASRWSSEFEETGSTEYGAALAGELGFETAADNLGANYEIDLGLDGNTTNGTIYVDPETDLGNVSTGDRINASESGTTVFLIPQDGGDAQEVTRDFALEGIQDAQGENITTVEFRDVSDPSLNSTDPLQRIRELNNLEDQAPVSSGIGGGLFGGGGPLGVPWVVWILGVFGLILVATRS